MTLQDIKNEIAALGFENDLSIDGAFIFSLRRALMTAYSERGIHKNLRIYQRTPTPDFHVEQTFHSAKETLRFDFDGGAYLFHTVGVGTYTVTDKSGSKTVDFYSDKATHKGFINEKGSISFTGDFCYTVYDLCHFKEILSDDEGDIFYARCKEYDLRDYAPDFLGICDDVRGADGSVIDGASVCAGILSVPYRYNGEIIIKYRCAPPEVSADSIDSHLDIDPEIAHLIPLLASSYIWLDDDAEKAQYYMTLYRNGMASLKMYSTRCLNPKYEDVTRWAK